MGSKEYGRILTRWKFANTHFFDVRKTLDYNQGNCLLEFLGSQPKTEELFHSLQLMIGGLLNLPPVL